MEYEILGRFLLAALWGGIIGAEREFRNKSAGFRTMILISAGACFFTLMSSLMNIPGIAQGIVTGVGFLGAGVIFRSESRVTGINTAATIWVVSAVGMGIGSGHYFISGFASLLILIVLTFLPVVDNFIEKNNQIRIYTVQCAFNHSAKENFERLFRENTLKFRLIKEIKNGQQLSLSWEISGRLEKHKSIVANLEQDEAVEKFEY
jgi:putative Mg2+ transporter-C (MgtC) family protein